ncbi:MAG TPA: hypothetical protein VNM72_02795 [Blastocatellia bacterium]|nr:hypothetical protein [Blastocatellia bacterium]
MLRNRVRAVSSDLVERLKTLEPARLEEPMDVALAVDSVETIERTL